MAISYYGYVGPESPSEYLENHVFPVLLPGLEEMLRTATTTERRKRFNALDYLVSYLYRHNQKHIDREDITLDDIPFVKEEWVKNPRPPLPLSATLTEDEASTIIQAHFRGFLVRNRPEAKLFRTWQSGVREERAAARKIQEFWREKTHPDKGNTSSKKDPPQEKCANSIQN